MQLNVSSPHNLCGLMLSATLNGGARSVWTANTTRWPDTPDSPFALLSACFDFIQLDLVGPLSTSNGYTYMLTVIDRFTRWPEVFPLTDIRTETIAQTFLQGWIVRFGSPITITTGRGSQFQFILWSNLMTAIRLHVWEQWRITHSQMSWSNAFIVTWRVLRNVTSLRLLGLKHCHGCYLGSGQLLKKIANALQQEWFTEALFVSQENLSLHIPATTLSWICLHTLDISVQQWLLLVRLPVDHFLQPLHTYPQLLVLVLMCSFAVTLLRSHYITLWWPFSHRSQDSQVLSITLFQSTD